MTNAKHCRTLRGVLRSSIERLWDEVQEAAVIAKQQLVVQSPGSANLTCAAICKAATKGYFSNLTLCLDRLSQFREHCMYTY
jgi:hypothetical protein